MMDEESAMAQKYLDILIALAPKAKLNKENQVQLMESTKQLLGNGQVAKKASTLSQEGNANVDASEEKVHADTVDKLLDEMGKEGAAPAKK